MAWSRQDFVLPRMALVTFSFAFDISVKIFHAAQDGIELAHVLERPNLQYIGHTRQVCVLYASTPQDRLHRVLSSQQEAVATGCTGTHVQAEDGTDWVVVGQPCDGSFAFASVGWAAMELKLLDHKDLLEPEPQSDFDVLTAAQLQELRKQFSTKHATTTVKRSVPEQMTVDGVPVTLYKSFMFNTDTTCGFHAGLEVTKDSKEGTLRVVLCSKPLTSSHHFALIEFHDGGFEFMTLRPTGPVSVMQPPRMASAEKFKQISKVDLSLRVRASFKDSLAKSITQKAVQVAPHLELGSRRPSTASSQPPAKKSKVQESGETADNDEQVLIETMRVCTTNISICAFVVSARL